MVIKLDIIKGFRTYYVEIIHKTDMYIEFKFNNNDIINYSDIFVFGKFVNDIKHISNDDLLFLTVSIFSDLINENDEIKQKLNSIDDKLRKIYNSLDIQ